MPRLSDDDMSCASDDDGTYLSNVDEEENSDCDKQHDDDDATPINKDLPDPVSTFFDPMLHD